MNCKWEKGAEQTADGRQWQVLMWDEAASEAEAREARVEWQKACCMEMTSALPVPHGAVAFCSCERHWSKARDTVSRFLPAATTILSICPLLPCA